MNGVYEMNHIWATEMKLQFIYDSFHNNFTSFTLISFTEHMKPQYKFIDLLPMLVAWHSSVGLSISLAGFKHHWSPEFFFRLCKLPNCTNCVHSCKGHSSFPFISFPQFIYNLFHTSFPFISFMGTHNWPAPNISGFIAQLVWALHRHHEVTGSNPIEVLNFFSGFTTRLHKLHSQLGGSFFIWKMYLDVGTKELSLTYFQCWWKAKVILKLKKMFIFHCFKMMKYLGPGQTLYFTSVELNSAH